MTLLAQIASGAKWFLKALITTGSILSIGCLSFAGALLLNPHWFHLAAWIWATVAFVLSILIEGLVYYQNISKTLDEFSGESHDHLFEEKATAPDLQQTLEEHIKDKQSFKKLDALEDGLEPIDWLLSFRARWRLHKNKKALEKAIETYRRKNPSLKATSEEPHKWAFYLLIVVLAALACGSTLFAALSAAQPAVALFGKLIHVNLAIGSALSWEICWPIAAFAGLATFLLTFNNLKESRDQDENHSHTQHKSTSYYLARLLLFLVVSFVTASVFWTYWSSGIAIGMKILPFLGGKTGVTAIMSALGAGTIITTFMWNASNTLKTIRRIEEFFQKNTFMQGLKKLFQPITTAWKTAWKRTTENGTYFYLFNPFRLLEYLINGLFRSVVLILHGLSMGLTADRFGPVPPLATTIIDGAAEIGVDIAYINPEEKEEEKEEAHDHDHTHFDLAGILLIPILLPLKCLRFIWNFIWSPTTLPSCKNLCALLCDETKQIFSNPDLDTKIEALLLPTGQPPFTKKPPEYVGLLNEEDPPQTDEVTLAKSH